MHSFLIGSSLFLQVTRTALNSWMGLKFSKIGPGSVELAGLNVWENSDLKKKTRCDHSSAFNFEWIFFIQEHPFFKYNNKTWVALSFSQVPLPTKKLAALKRPKIDVRCCDHFSMFIINWIFITLVGNKDDHNSLN